MMIRDIHIHSHSIREKYDEAMDLGGYPMFIQTLMERKPVSFPTVGLLVRQLNLSEDVAFLHHALRCKNAKLPSHALGSYGMYHSCHLTREPETFRQVLLKLLLESERAIPSQGIGANSLEVFFRAILNIVHIRFSYS